MELEKGVQRWVVEISNWKPSPSHFSFAMSFLPHHEHSSITRFVKLEDQKRALVSRLLQYALVHQVLGIPFDEIIIRRTPEGKPFLVYDNVKSRFPNFNFNVSHHGDYVAIASEPVCLVGLDIVSHSIPMNETADEFIRSFSSYFSTLEWYHISNAGSSDEMLKFFHRYWCLKEAFVKAMGSGVGYKLDDVEFHHTNWDNIFVKVAGKEMKDWKFWLLEIGQNHSVCIARGHPRTAIKSYMKTLKQTEFDENEYNLGLHLPNASLMFLTVEDLIQLCDHADSPSINVSRNPRVSDEDETE
ncbi:Alpha-aminoadipic semialdehyde dehydrogenase-phosphopantetheinyl transferase [Handroanthus impetiginosus]|uniref:holo-[acyl-carrier-protein] synthase n=1 Tax=Handroanthus impetiginosus TaxID=429701 RepID=A0A2G9IA63_9LAMI|nr:Alpha-aminoadipic semialdehyde dehydrogenase-phosphopantetheinyl transferase [Handroanthus impetiginosus]